jgi:branched-chain amino acid transport system ATP-binding protein
LGLARSFQINNLFGAMTVHQNVRNAALSRGSHRLNLLRRITGMNDIEEKTSMVLRTVGLEFSSGMQADELPYGHQRALEIAIALATDPHVVLLDEPTAGMDKEETRATVALIKEVTKGKTVVVVDHDMEVVFSIADRISVVYYGRVLATGTPDEIRNNREVNEAYLGSRNPC